MRKTKIVCTLGPSTDSEKVLTDMILAGMDVARFNFSHGTHETHKERFDMLDKLRRKLKLPIATLLDTKGPEIRTGDFKNGKEELKKGQQFTLTPRDVLGDTTITSITYKSLFEDVEPGTHILIDDGKVEMIVREIVDEDIICEVLNDGPVANHKGINVPGVSLSLQYISQVDREDILYGAELGFDFVAASFVRTARDVMDLRELLDTNGYTEVKIIAKIENEQGVSNIDEILQVSNGIMIARGDMAVEIDFTEIPVIQKRIIQKCYNSGRPAITATQMLESMMTSPRPTRAEITDVANAIYDGTSAIMLSGESAAGMFPVEAVRTMAAIAERTENDINYERRFKSRSEAKGRLSITAAVAHATCTTAMDTDARAIITVSKSGETARLLCKYRPSTPIIACVMSEQICRQLSLSWGITPIVMPYATNTDELITMSVEAALEHNLVQNGDLAIITAGVPVGISGTTNMIKAHLVGDSLVSGVGMGSQNAIGRVRIVRSVADLVTDGFNNGDVLVTRGTTNEMLMAMRNSAAIITEEGGTNSHAAIVGLTLDKPVIVDASGATTKLHDGQLVTVDSKRGIVQSMPD